MSTRSAGSIVYTVDANTQGFMDGMAGVDRRLAGLNQGFSSADRAGQAFGGGLNRITQGLVALVAVNSLKNLQALSEEFTVLAARINKLSANADVGAQTYGRLLAISSNTGSDLGTAVKTWESLTGTLKEMGKTNDDIVGVTDTLLKMGSIGGSSTEEMKNGLRQLGQSFAGGIVRGEEFNSVLENIPEVARQIAKGMGISFSELRASMLAGKLTADVVFDAIRKQAAGVEVEFGKMPRTVSAAANAISNEFGNALSKLDKEAGFSKTLATAIDLVASKIGKFAGDAEAMADALDMITGAAVTYASIMAGRVLTSLGSYVSTQFTAIAATLAANQANKLQLASEVQKAEALHAGNLAELERAKSAVAGATASVTASRQAQAAEITRLEGTIAALQGEKALEAQRLKSQISEQGRAATIARMVEIQRAQLALTGQLTAAQAALTATTVSSSTAVTAALASRAVASDAAAASSARVTAATVAMASAASGATIVMNGLKTAMAFLGGPTGVIILAAVALTYFASQADKAKVDVDGLKGSLDKLTFSQLSKTANDAGEDIVNLNKKLSNSYSELNTMSKRPWEDDADLAKRKTAAQAEIDDIKEQISKRKDLQEQIKAQQAEITKEQELRNQPSKPRERKTSAEDQKVLDNLKEQRALAGLAGDARARLAAEQKLSATASAEEKKAAGDLAVEIYRLTEGKKDAAKATKDAAAEAKKEAREAERAAEQNAKAIEDYGLSIAMAAMHGEDLARAQAKAKLNKFATPEDVAEMERLGQAMAVVQKQNELRAAQSQVSPLGQEVAAYTQQMATLSELQAADAANYQYYQDLKTAAAMDHDEKVRALEEAAFIRQSEGNAFLMRSIDALGQATTNTITGLLSGTLNAQDAMKGFASIILNEVVGSIVQMGVQAVKQALIQKSVQAAAAAGYVASVAAQVSVNTALAAQATFASTSAIPVVGPAAAPAAAAAAGAAAAGLGAPAVASAAGVAAGGRLYGGPVSGDNMYAVSEDGKPEILEQDNGKRYLLGGQGNVVSNKDMGGGANIAVSIVINSDGSQSTQSSSNNDINAMAENVKSVVINQLQLEMRQGGTLWEFQNGRT